MTIVQVNGGRGPTSGIADENAAHVLVGLGTHHPIALLLVPAITTAIALDTQNLPQVTICQRTVSTFVSPMMWILTRGRNMMMKRRRKEVNTSRPIRHYQRIGGCVEDTYSNNNNNYYYYY